MFKTVFVIFLLAHILGDFYFFDKSDEKQNLSKAFIHNFVYSLVIFILILPIINKWIVFAWLFTSITHFIIEWIKYRICRRKKNLSELAPYLAGQALHIILIVIASVFVSYNCNTVVFPEWMDSIFNIIGIGELQFLSWTLMILLIWKPVNITIKKVLSPYKPTDSLDISDAEDKNTGGFIGLLERIIILIFLSIKQYSAIGLVLTAKSIARYNKIAEDKTFAEYYLLGTLLSTLSVIVVYLAVYN